MTPAPKAQRSPASHARNTRPSEAGAWALALAALLLGAWFRIAWPIDVPELTPDEQYVAHYGYGLLHHGFADVHATLDHYNRTPQLWQFPSPARLGPTLVAAAVIAVTGSEQILNLALWSTLVSLLTLPLLFWSTRRRFGGWAAAVAVLFLAVSPLDIAVARHAWQESSLALLGLGLLATAAELLEPSAHRGWWALHVALGAAALMFKESMALVLGLVTLGLALVSWRATRDARAMIPPLAAGAAAVAIAGGLTVLACGGIAPVRESLSHLLVAGPRNEYLERFQRGTPAYYLVGLGLLEPLPWLLGTLASVLALTRTPFMLQGWNRPSGRPVLLLLAGFALCFEAFAAFYPQKNMRFLSPLWPANAGLAGVFVIAALRAVRARAARATYGTALAATAVLLGVSAVVELQRFVHFFLELRIGDLATPWFTGR